MHGIKLSQSCNQNIFNGKSNTNVFIVHLRQKHIKIQSNPKLWAKGHYFNTYRISKVKLCDYGWNSEGRVIKPIWGRRRR